MTSKSKNQIELSQNNSKLSKSAQYFGWWSCLMLALLVFYFLGGSQIGVIKPFMSHVSNFAISGFLTAGLMAYAAILFPPKGTKRFRDADSNVLHPKFRYVFLIIFMFVILLNIVVDVLGGMNHLTFFVLEFSQINTVDYMDAVAGTMSVCISASFYYYAVWHRSGSRWPRF